MLRWVGLKSGIISVANLLQVAGERWRLLANRDELVTVEEAGLNAVTYGFADHCLNHLATAPKLHVICGKINFYFYRIFIVRCKSVAR